MIKSMTGFGRAEMVSAERKITVEVRSLNSKQMDLSVRIPSIYREREAEIRNLVAQTASRGKTELTVSYQNTAAVSAGNINHQLFVEYYKELSELLSKVERSTDHEHLLTAVLKMPEVISVQTVQISDEEWAKLLETVGVALSNFDNFRQSEGQVLMNDLMARIDTIERLSVKIPQYESERVEAVKNRLAENLEKLKVDIDRNRLEQELIYYIEKFDITEEKVRLKRHLDYFREVSQTPEAGRKLGFIAQEIGREINTTGSKANHAEIQKIVVEMKDELEKIKEQLLNIL